MRGTVLAMLLASACVSVPAQTRLEPVDERMGIAAGVQLGAAREAALKAMETLAGGPDRCQAEQIALQGSRRAWLLETCDWAPEGLLMDNVPVTALHLQFLDDELVQILVQLPPADRFAGDDSDASDSSSGGPSPPGGGGSLADLKAALQRVWGEPAPAMTSPVELWQTSHDRALLEPSIDPTSMALRLLDATLVDEPALQGLR